MSVNNSCLFIGNLARDAELKFTAGGLAICKFSIAVNSKVKHGDQWVDEVSFFELTLFGKRGESLNQYLTKGTPVAVECRAKQDRWEQDGQTRTKITFIADDIRLLGGKREGNDSRGRDESEDWGADRRSESSGQSRQSGQGAGAGHSSVDAARAARGSRAAAGGGGAPAGDDGFVDDIPF